MADLLSKNNSTKEIKANLRILLQNDHYKIAIKRTESLVKEVQFKYGQAAHKEFWNIYKRLPKEGVLGLYTTKARSASA